MCHLGPSASIKNSIASTSVSHAILSVDARVDLLKIETFNRSNQVWLFGRRSCAVYEQLIQSLLGTALVKPSATAPLIVQLHRQRTPGVRVSDWRLRLARRSVPLIRQELLAHRCRRPFSCHVDRKFH